MHRLRSPGLIRLLALVTIVSTLMLSAAPAMGHRGAHVAYGEWLRSQLRAPMDAVLEKSLAEAEAERHRSLTAFLAAFVADVEASGSDAGRFFGVDGLGGAHLVTFLESRFSHLTADALPARSVLTVAPTTVTSQDRWSTSAVRFDIGRAIRLAVAAAVVSSGDAVSFTRSLHSVLRPRAP